MVDNKTNMHFQFPANRRGAISSTTSTESNESIPIIEKDSSTMKLLSRAVEDNILFRHLDENECTKIFSAMALEEYSSGDIIILQDDKGDYFYIIEKGEVDVYINEALMTCIGECSCFGELALIHTTPTVITLKAKTDVKLWSLCGETYRGILMDLRIKKSKTYEEFLSKVPILKTLNECERSIVADALESRQYQDGEVVVRQDDVGEEFFIIVEGHGVVYQKMSELSPLIEINTLGPGDYFGEIALLCNRTRVATIIAKGILSCVQIDRTRFERVLGSIRTILERNIPRYNSMIHLDELQNMISKTDIN